MVVSISIPLKPSDEAIVTFLMRLVFGSQKTQNGTASRRECMKHDVFAASKLIEWILNSDKKNRKSFTVVCNLVYGNTIVLSAQVARLLLDALRAREVVSFHAFEAIEEERKRKTKEQMQKALRESDDATPKKKRKSKDSGNEDVDFPLSSPIPTALKQNITMADVFHEHNLNEFVAEDDLAPMDETQMQMLYGILERESSNPIEKTFVERQSSTETREQVRNIDLDFEFQDIIQERQQTPLKDIPEEIFEPSPHLKDILLRRGCPMLTDGEQRKSIEEEMEEARHQGISDIQIDSQHPIDVPRIFSEQMDLDDEIFVPKTPRTPRSIVKNPVPNALDEADGINCKVPLREMHRLMDDFSSLVHSNTEVLRRKPKAEMNLQQLLSPVPFLLRKQCNKELANIFTSKPKMFDKTIGNDASTPEGEDNDQEPDAERRRDEYEEMEAIELSQLKIVATPLKERPLSPIACAQEDLEVPRRLEENFQEDFIPPRTPTIEDPVFEEPHRFTIRSPIDCIRGDEKSIQELRSVILQETTKSSPFGCELDSLLRENSSRREASRLFYVALELLKEQEIVAEQKTPFSVIELRINCENSDDVDALLD